MEREYDKSDISSIFNYSGRLVNHTLAEVMSEIDPSIGTDELEHSGKGGLGVLVEKYFSATSKTAVRCPILQKRDLN